MVSSADLLLHPVRLRIVQAFLGDRALTTSQLSAELSDIPPAFDPDKYDDHGKYMDGWESRRKRGPGHDYAVVKLAAPGVQSLG